MIGEFFFFALIKIVATSFVFIFLPAFIEEETDKERLEGKQEVSLPK